MKFDIDGFQGKDSLWIVLVFVFDLRRRGISEL
jgi:hypothetical protein